MNPEQILAELGQPDISFDHFQVWTHGRQFENAQDYWDANWMNVTVRCCAPGADVWAEGPILHLCQLEEWLQELEQMNRTTSGKAGFSPIEPNLYVEFEMDKLGHIAVHIHIMPEHHPQTAVSHHDFRYEIDQSYLPGLIRQIQTILQDYSIRGEKPSKCQPSQVESERGRPGSLWARFGRIATRLWRRK